MLLRLLWAPTAFRPSRLLPRLKLTRDPPLSLLTLPARCTASVAV
ncbi:hypothetical protein EVA_10066 [gut metagenome]|uniref:Uncharacterized protein n=1 Tax=gut metagenome TaxID=749906 RepID=J9CNY2_9ZZZZ